jgi:ABC-type microcin C transport system duplicated ATPase subunit YejF
MECSRVRGLSLVERLNDIPRHVLDIVEFDVHRGETIALIVGELYSGHILLDMVDLSRNLPSEALEEMLGYHMFFNLVLFMSFQLVFCFN